MPRALRLFSASPLPTLARSSFGWSYARWLRCALPGARVRNAGLAGEYGDSNPRGTARHRPGTWLLKPIRDASLFREPTPLSAFATTREDVGYLLENRGPREGAPQSSMRSIVQLASWMAVSSSRLWRASSSILRVRGPTSTAGRIRISARP